MRTLTVNTHEAKSRLSELLRLVEQGDHVFLARNGVTLRKLFLPPKLAPFVDPALPRG
jgi:hypothetical protein